MRLTESALRRIIRETANQIFEAEKTGISAVDWLTSQGKSGESSLLGAPTVGAAVTTMKGQGPFMQRQKGLEGTDDISLGKRIQLGPSKVTFWRVLPGGRRKPEEIIGANTLKNKPVTWLLGYMFKNGASRVGPQEGPVPNPAYEYSDREHKNYVYHVPGVGFMQVDNVSDPVRAKIFNMYRNAQFNATQQDYVNFYDSVERGDVKLGDVAPVGLSSSAAVAEPEAARPTDVRKILSDEAEKRNAAVTRVLSRGKPQEVEFYKRLVSKIANALDAIHVNNPEEVRRKPLDVLSNVDANLFQTTMKQMGLPTVFERSGLGKDAYKLANWSPEEFQALRDQFVGPRV